MRITLSVKLSLKNERHRQIAEALQKEPSVSGAIAAILEYYYFEREAENRPNMVTPDNREVLAAIAELSRKLDNIKHAPAPYQPTPDIARKQEPEVTEAQLDLEHEFVVAVTKAARPGKRLQD